MRLALGTAQFGFNYGIANSNGQLSHAEISKLLELCSLFGVNMLDTAQSYGKSEANLGACKLNNFKTITKLEQIPGECKDLSSWFDSSLRGSIKRLNVKNIYGILLHHPKDLFREEGLVLYELLMKAKNSGLVEKIGVSVYDPSEIEMIFNKFYFDIVQSPFNVFDQRLKTSGWLHKLKSKGVEIHVRSIYLQGLLLMDRGELPAQFIRWATHFEKWYEWLKSNEVSATEACLRSVMSNPEIDRVIFGVDSIDQFLQTVHIFNRPISGYIPDLESRNEGLINPRFWK